MTNRFQSISLFFLAWIIFSAKPIFAQVADGGAFGAPVIKFSSIGGQNAIITGGRFGWVIDSSIVLGGGFYSLTNKVKTGTIDQINGSDVLLGFNCGGLEFEYLFYSGSKVHFSIDMFFAGGGLTFSASDNNTKHANYFSQDLLLWEPQLNVEFDLADWLHLDTGISYRIISGYTESYGISLNDLKGISAAVTFKFGSY